MWNNSSRSEESSDIYQNGTACIDKELGTTCKSMKSFVKFFFKRLGSEGRGVEYKDYTDQGIGSRGPSREDRDRTISIPLKPGDTSEYHWTTGIVRRGMHGLL